MSSLKRMKEFVDYHINGDGECNNIVLKEWVEIHKLELQDIYILSFLFSVTYCVESAIILFEEQRKCGGLNINQTKKIKPSILFQSDRKYMAMKDSFEKCLTYFFKNNSDVYKFLGIVEKDGIIQLEKAIKYVSSWVMFGRFSAFLFLETFVELSQMKTENTTIEWRKGNTATSGLLNLYGYDDYANIFDKENKLMIKEYSMDKMLKNVLFNIKKAGGNTNVTYVETSLCAYRKFFKGSRYNGYYLDRMLEEIYFYNKRYPEISRELLGIRKSKFDSNYLGEIKGWTGIRKDMKKYYLMTGKVS